MEFLCVADGTGATPTAGGIERTLSDATRIDVGRYFSLPIFPMIAGFLIFHDEERWITRGLRSR